MTRRLVLALLALVLAGCGVAPAVTVARSVTVPPMPGTAASVLATLTVRDRDPVGYQRTAFGPAWADADHNGCDTRDDILRRDLTATTTAGRCTVTAGVLRDPYTGATVVFRRGRGTSSAVQIDHVVALADAWRAGANTWTPAQRLGFANDPGELLAVAGPTNDAKGDHTVDEWAPADPGARCRLATIVVTIKHAYRLSVTAPEHDALARLLAPCPDQRARSAP